MQMLGSQTTDERIGFTIEDLGGDPVPGDSSAIDCESSLMLRIENPGKGGSSSGEVGDGRGIARVLLVP